jgi:hypothetical protein
MLRRVFYELEKLCPNYVLEGRNEGMKAQKNQVFSLFQHSRAMVKYKNTVIRLVLK